LKIFIGKGSCTNCHNGPLLTDNHFHNTGVPAIPGLPADDGRAVGAVQVKSDPFNCLGPYSDAKPAQCAELKFMTATGPELVRAYKTPSLRDVVNRPPYMHAGQIASLAEVLEHYNEAPAAPAAHSELKPLRLTPSELKALEAFLASLSEIRQ
jgi:cytochrome c peroxidase